MEETKLELDVHERPKIAKWIILAIQHVFAMFGATVLVPILVNSACGEEVLTIPVALVSSGIGTLIYILCTRGKSPVYLGSSFAFIAPMIAAYAKSGREGVFTGVIAVGLIYVIVATIVHFVGKKWINKILPSVVIGPMIIIIGLGLAPSAIGQIGLDKSVDDASLKQEIVAQAATEELTLTEEEIGNKVKEEQTLYWKGIVVALVAFLTTGLVALKGKGFLKIIPFLIGIIAGFIAGALLGLVDFNGVKEASIVGVPNFYIPFLNYTPSLAALLTIAPVAFVTICEHIGDHTALSVILGRDLLKKPGLDKTMLGDGVATAIAGLLGGPPNTTYGENTSVVGMTKVASVWVIGLAAIIAILLGFVTKFTSLVSAIPGPVLGGVSILLYGFIASNGLKILVKNKVDFGKTRNVIIASTMLVLGLGGAAISLVKGDISVTMSGMSLAAVVGILLNLFLPYESKEDKEEAKKEVESKE